MKIIIGFIALLVSFSSVLCQTDTANKSITKDTAKIIRYTKSKNIFTKNYNLDKLQKFWFEMGIGFGYDKSFFKDFSTLWSLRTAVSYQINRLKLTPRFMVIPGYDGIWDEVFPKRTIRDYAFLVGYNYDKKYLGFSVSAGISYQEGNAHGDIIKVVTEAPTPVSLNKLKNTSQIEQSEWASFHHDVFYYENIKLNNWNLPIEMQLLWTLPNKAFGLGLLLFCNLNSKCNTYGFQIVYGGGFTGY